MDPSTSVSTFGELAQVVGAVGAVCIVAAFAFWLMVKKFQEEQVKRETALSSKYDTTNEFIRDRLTGVVNSNTAALTQINTTLQEMRVEMRERPCLKD